MREEGRETKTRKRERKMENVSAFVCVCVVKLLVGEREEKKQS